MHDFDNGSLSNENKPIYLFIGEGVLLGLFAGGWLLVAGCWLLVTGYWLLTAVCLLLLRISTDRYYFSKANQQQATSNQ